MSAHSSDLIIKSTSLTFQYSGSSDSISFPDLSIEAGTHSLFLGRSGSGKTTWLHMLAGLLRPSEGHIDINGQSMGEMSKVTLDRFRATNIGIVFQQPHLIRSLSVLENIRIGQYFGAKRISDDTIRAKAESLGMTDVLHRSVRMLSVGQAQRVSLLRAVIGDPVLLLADEPTASLDDENADAVMGLLLKMSVEANATLVIATHDARIKNRIANRYEL